MSRPDLVIAILAAGGSRRLGRAKQLVALGEVPLLRRQCLCALNADLGDVIAILGPDAFRHAAAIADLPVDVQINSEWTEGLAATLRMAVRRAQARRASLLLLHCDQYRVTPGDLRELADRWRLTPSIPCLSRWNDYLGPPAILPLEYHAHVMELRGDTGARSVLYGDGRRCPIEVASPRAVYDVDSPADVVTAESWSARPSDFGNT